MLLSSIMGIDLRTTMDMDTTIVGIDMNQEELKRILMEILSIDVDDNVRFEYISTSKIKDEDLYGGFRFKINAYLNKLRANLQIDVATGDIITPRAIEYKYKCLFDDKYLDLITYNLETVLAEKFNSVISIGVLNSRMKDYYDIYYLLTRKSNEIDKKILKQAIINTFDHQKTDIHSIKERFEQIRENSKIDEQWRNYSKKHHYTINISKDDLMNEIEKIVELFSEDCI